MGDTGSRRHKTWKRPPEFIAGWTRGPALIIPWVEWQGELKTSEVPPPDTFWIPGPIQHHALAFALFWSARDVAPEDIHSVFRPGVWILARLPLANGENVWLTAEKTEMAPHDRAFIDRTEKIYRGVLLGDADLINAWALSITTSPVGTPLVIHFQLGMRHFVLGR